MAREMTGNGKIAGNDRGEGRCLQGLRTFSCLALNF